MTPVTQREYEVENSSPDAASDLRFRFGENWTKFLEGISDKAIAYAKTSLLEMTGMESFRNKRFLDIGSGSGLFSLAAYQLGAQITSFDYDEESVNCTTQLKQRANASDADWIVNQGSVLDQAFMKTLATYDIVYSWGVLHHTGALWQALNNAAQAVKIDGLLYIAIYNDQGRMSLLWKRIKWQYNRLPISLRPFYAAALVIPLELVIALVYILRLDPVGYIRSWTHYDQKSGRGMNKWRDWVDWIGGYPFEVAKPEAVLDAVRPLGFELERLKTYLGRWGCNEYVFRRVR